MFVICVATTVMSLSEYYVTTNIGKVVCKPMDGYKHYICTYLSLYMCMPVTVYVHACHCIIMCMPVTVYVHVRLVWFTAWKQITVIIGVRLALCMFTDSLLHRIV